MELCAFCSFVRLRLRLVLGYEAVRSRHASLMPNVNCSRSNEGLWERTADPTGIAPTATRMAGACATTSVETQAGVPNPALTERCATVPRVRVPPARGVPRSPIALPRTHPSVPGGPPLRHRLAYRAAAPDPAMPARCMPAARLITRARITSGAGAACPAERRSRSSS